MRDFIFICLLAMSLISCEKLTLDQLAFPSEKLDSYTFSNYNGEIGIDETMYIDDSKKHLVELISTDISTGDQYKIYGVYIGDITTISSDSIILYFHGQSKHMDHYFSRAALLANVGGKYNYGVFMIDYRGYGMSEGESTEQGLYEDGEAAISWLKNQGADQNRVFYYGYSLGAIPIIDRAAYRTDFKPKKLILEAPLASVENLVHNSTVINVDPGFVTTLEFNNAEKIKDVSCPLLWMHGKEDTYIAISNGELIYGNHNAGEKIAVRVDGSDHSEIPPKYGIDNYMNEILNFIQD